MAEKFIYSTLTADQNYTIWEPGEGGLNRQVSQVFIKGGTNVADKVMRTPLGVLTKVSDDQYGQLVKNEVFKTHLKNGFIKVMDKEYNPEVVAADMKTRDDSAPLTPNDYPEDTKGAKPHTKEK